MDVLQDMNTAETPLATLVTPEGVTFHRTQDRTVAEIRERLSLGSVRFAVAEVGVALAWIPDSERFAFWKTEALGHIADAEKTCLAHWPDGYFYRASEWHSVDDPQTIILLEKNH